MSDASNPARARTRPWNDRVDPWVGALLSLLLHLLMLWVLLHADVPVVQTTQGAPAGAPWVVCTTGTSACSSTHSISRCSSRLSSAPTQGSTRSFQGRVRARAGFDASLMPSVRRGGGTSWRSGACGGGVCAS